VSEVIRAEEHLTNTVRQALILEALGYTLPEYAHLSLVLGEDRSKLSKRHGATSVDQFRQEGFLPVAMLNYLCNLGWNDGTDKEIYTPQELIDAFELERVTKSPAVFDMKKLRWINGQHLRALPEEERAALIGECLASAGLAKEAQSPFVSAASRMVAEKVELVNDATELVREALLYPLSATLDEQKAMADDEDFGAVSRALLQLYRDANLPDPSSDDFEAEWKKSVKALGKELGLKGKALFMPLRVATTGRTSGPDLAAQLRVLALAEGGSDAQAVTLAQRMDELEHALGKL